MNALDLPIVTYTSFSKETYDAFKADNRSGPLHLMNLIRLREWASYEDGQKVSGRQAYEAYSRISAPVFSRLGGRIAWRGNFEMMMVGPSTERWDIAFVAEYPSIEAFVQMMKDPQYREAMQHRQAGVADSRLIRFAAIPFGQTFGGN